MPPLATQFDSRLCSGSVLIANGATESSPINLNGTSLAGLVIPSGFQGTSLKFKVSADGTNYSTYGNAVDGSDITYTVAAGKAWSSAPIDFSAWQYVKLVAGTAQNQDITIGVQSMPI